MTFKVILTDRAIRDIEEAVAYFRDVSPQVADGWLLEFWSRAESLKELPLRHAVIEEADGTGLTHRSALVYSHRLIYRIDEVQTTVYIVRVYHGARRPLGTDDY